MPGTRLVLNSRYFHIARAGEKADGNHCMTKDSVMGLVNYVGTRESVELNVINQSSLYDNNTPLNLDPLKLSKEVAERPATKKQIDTISDLLKEIPEAKNSLEYTDYKNNNTIGNATELISRASEIGLGYAVDLGKAKNLLEYVGKRPGVDRVGEHGLFSSSNNVDIKKAQEEISNCKGNVWTHVISLRREDADALGYDSQKPWRDLVMQKIDVIAKASNIPVSELHWYAGMHNTTHHPHIHLFVFSDNPKGGKLTVKGINEMKSAFSEVIFADERLHIYKHKDQMRNEIKNKVDEILSHIEKNVSKQFSEQELNSICDKMLCLSNELKERSGKMQYGWIKDLNIRKQVNEIMVDLSKSPDIQKLYELYCEDHKDLQRMYRNNPNDIGPILKNKEFNSIKNKIIREAVKLTNKASQNEETENINHDTSSLLSNEESLFASIPDEKEEFIPPEDYAPLVEYESQNYKVMEDYEPPEQHNYSKHDKQTPQSDEKSFTECRIKAIDGDTKSKYRLAKKYFYGNGVERDYVKAQMWYGLSAKDGHSFAKYELGKMYLYGIGIDKDLQLGKEYCLDAYWDFRFAIAKTCGYDVGNEIDLGCPVRETVPDHKKNSYLMYCIGRTEYGGEGVERDYKKAFLWFQLAAVNKYAHSNYYLAKMYHAGEGILKNFYSAKYYYEKAAESKDIYAYYALGKMYDTGTGVEQSYKTAFNWFVKSSMENVPYADYRLGQMYEKGEGTEIDEKMSDIFYEKTLEEFIEQEKQLPDTFTEYRVANMYLKGKGTKINVDEAVKWLNKCIEKKDPRAQYQLAVMYQKGEDIQQDEKKVQELYSAALKGFIRLEKDAPSAQAEYKIASMYDKGNGSEQNAEQAYIWYVKSSENGNPHAAYCTAKACLNGLGTNQDFDSAIKWFSMAADGNNPYAMYSLGKMYRDGIGVKQNLESAYKYFLAAAKLEHEFAQFAVAKALLNGSDTEKNIPEGIKWLNKCIVRGNHYAEYKMAELLSDGTLIPKDEVKANSLYTSSLTGFLKLENTEPNPQLEYLIGNMHLKGKGTQADVDEAVKWLSLSADNGNPFAAYKVAKLIENNPSNLKSQFYYNLALNGFIDYANKNSDSSLAYTIGQMLYQGKGTAISFANAFHWFNISAKNGSTYAQFQIARMLEKGEGVPQDEQKSQEMYSAALKGFIKLSADENSPEIEYRIGTMYEFGLGTLRNVETAKKWYTQAADSCNEYAANRLKQIEDFQNQIAVNSILGLFRAFARNMGNNIKDSTTQKYRQDRKLLHNQKLLKMSRGQKYEGQQQSM